MNHSTKITIMMFLLMICGVSCKPQFKSSNVKESAASLPAKKMVIQLILGSTRQGRISPKIANALKIFADKRTDITTEIIDLRDYNLPFLNDEVVPASRKEITDPVIKKWSDKIKQADAFIMIVPVYNASYPGVLKNALDTLYQEWNNKPVAFVGYSGGLSGGASAIDQLRTVADAFKMVPVDKVIKIPQSWKAFDETGALVQPTIEQDVNDMIDELKSAYALITSSVHK